MSAAVASMTNVGPQPAAPAWLWGPAGRDVQLARAISDLTTGGYLGSTRELLASVRTSFDRDRRAYCTSVLAAVIVRRHLHIDEQWLSDEPKNSDALLLHARVLAVRAIHAARANKPSASKLAARAVEACRNAVWAADPDPTPWVTLLSLGETGVPLPALRLTTDAPDGLPVSGPWPLFAEIFRRDPHNREAMHRLIPRCSGPYTAALWTPDSTPIPSTDEMDATAREQMAVWASDSAPAGSPLKLLRLMHAPARDPFPNAAEEMRLRNHLHTHGKNSREQYLRERLPAMEERWRLALRADAVKLANTWFQNGSQPPYMPLSDLSFLAYYLHQVREYSTARLVLTWMIPHATTDPWKHDGDPGAVLTKTCLDCHVPPSSLPR
ncbi:hypothetical protein KGQ19_12860 [Catenulispora sp. NL8]|uniref:Uncharacterized protein n=1 Tax=Catenulispora pinistramenti TaxID=2705254 RepID=A0ABS5KNY4_9ACTN|nr:hypothetical protein [Catenulispora pinistramenti]MBS2547758.1 hypothetical protein [Catenulispora pinistramenti]